jgi:hypothetical protein
MATHLVSALDHWLSKPLVAEVLRHRNEDVAKHEVTPSPGWLPYLDADAHARSIGERYAGCAISREMLGAAGRRVFEARPDARGDELVTAFVMCQMWGGGGSGRTMANTRRAFEDPSRARDALNEFAEAVATDPAAAAVGNLPGWKASFSTKLGYALTYDNVTAKGGRPALIYDNRVVDSLKTFVTWDHGGYAGYLEAMWSVASRHGVRADAVEYLLFWPWLDLRTWESSRPGYDHPEG